MQIGFKFHNCRGFGRLDNYAYKYNCMITKEAKQKGALKAALNYYNEAFNVLIREADDYAYK